jgi:hypothetical protein
VPKSKPQKLELEANPQGRSGNKYRRAIYPAAVSGEDKEERYPIEVDIYSVLQAYGNPPAPVGHAVKKLLCAGVRGKATQVQDIKEAIDALTRYLGMLELEGFS